MNNFLNTMRVEAWKARRSKISVVTLLACFFVPLMGALFMMILKYPQKAQSLGLISAKAPLFASTASWESYLRLLSQTAAVGGMVLFSFIAAWVFGREYICKTVKDLLALPTSRTTIVLAKFAVITLWSFLLSLVTFFVATILGFMIQLPGWGYQLWFDNLSRFIILSFLTIPLAWAIAFIANLGKSYFPAIGFLFFMVVLATIAEALGWAAYFPWAIPSLYSDVAGPTKLGAVSYLIVVLAGLLGIAGTLLWWRYADYT